MMYQYLRTDISRVQAQILQGPPITKRTQFPSRPFCETNPYPDWVRFFKSRFERTFTVKQLIVALALGALAMGAASKVDVYSKKDVEALTQKLLQKRTQFASQQLEQYGNHYTMLAVRTKTGSSELHEHEADVFVVESGRAMLVTGGKMVSPHTEKAGEIRGTSIAGGERRQVGEGDIIHIPANTPHQLVIENGTPFTYFVVKVTGQ
jgi:mannose-6-phosphate isomerase-like protein (cupin superfamily)